MVIVGASLVSGMVMSSQRSISEEELFIILLLLGIIPLVGIVYITIVIARLIYRMWSFIQDGHARATPGKALGFCFIPLFNLYWVFQVFPGFAADFNRLVERHDLGVKKMPVGLFTTYAVLCVAGMIPFVGLVSGVVVLFVLPVMIAHICDGVNALPPLDQLKAAGAGFSAEKVPPAPVYRGPAPRRPSSRRSTNVAIGVVVGIIMVLIVALVLAVSVPDLFEGQGRAFARQTIGEMRVLEEALQQYRLDHDGFPACGNFTGLVRELEPVYLRSCPRRDAWGHPFRYQVTKDGFLLVSPGEDGLFSTGSSYSYPANFRAIRDARDDLVLSENGWLQGPPDMAR
jgi:hypothetical protein